MLISLSCRCNKVPAALDCAAGEAILLALLFLHLPTRENKSETFVVKVIDGDVENRRGRRSVYVCPAGFLVGAKRGPRSANKGSC